MSKVGQVTRKGQVTLPAEMRRMLGVSEGDRVEFDFKDGYIRVQRYVGFAERTAGIFKVEGPPLSAEELRAEAEKAWIHEIAEEEAAMKDKSHSRG